MRQRDIESNLTGKDSTLNPVRDSLLSINTSNPNGSRRLSAMKDSRSSARRDRTSGVSSPICPFPQSHTFQLIRTKRTSKETQI
jgi:hypothetical protein